MTSMNQQRPRHPRYTNTQNMRGNYQPMTSNSQQQTSSQQTQQTATPHMTFPQGFQLRFQYNINGHQFFDMAPSAGSNVSSQQSVGFQIHHHNKQRQQGIRAPTMINPQTTPQQQQFASVQGTYQQPPPSMPNAGFQQIQANYQYYPQYQNTVSMSQPMYTNQSTIVNSPYQQPATQIFIPVSNISNDANQMYIPPSSIPAPPPSETPQSNYGSAYDYKPMTSSQTGTLQRKKNIIPIVNPNTKVKINQDALDLNAREGDFAHSEAAQSGRETVDSTHQSITDDITSPGDQQYAYFNRQQQPALSFSGAVPAHEVNAFTMGGHPNSKIHDTSQPPPLQYGGPSNFTTATHQSSGVTQDATDASTPNSQMKQEFFKNLATSDASTAASSSTQVANTTVPPPYIKPTSSGVEGAVSTLQNFDAVTFKDGADRVTTSASDKLKTPSTIQTPAKSLESATNLVVNFADGQSKEKSTNISYEFTSNGEMTQQQVELKVSRISENVIESKSLTPERDQSEEIVTTKTVVEESSKEEDDTNGNLDKPTDLPSAHESTVSKSNEPIESTNDVTYISTMEDDIIVEDIKEASEENECSGDDRFSFSQCERVEKTLADLRKIRDDNPKMYNPETRNGDCNYSVKMLRLMLEMQKILVRRPKIDRSTLKNYNFVDIIVAEGDPFKDNCLPYFMPHLLRSHGTHKSGGRPMNFAPNYYNDTMRSSGSVRGGRYDRRTMSSRDSRSNRMNSSTQGGKGKGQIVIERPSMANVKLHEQSEENKWKSASKEIEKAEDESLKAKLEAIKNARAVLNRLAADTFDFFIYDGKSKKKGEWFTHYKPEYAADIISILFEKAIDEPRYCAIYSDICKIQQEIEIHNSWNKMSSFRTALLKIAQSAFESNEYSDEALKELALEIKAAKKDFKVKEAALEVASKDNTAIAEAKEERKKAKDKLEALEERMFRARKKMFGIIGFIGQLYARKIIPLSIVHSCFIRLYNRFKDKRQHKEHKSSKIDEEAIECSIRLYESVGLTILRDVDGIEKCSATDNIYDSKTRLNIYLNMLSDTKPFISKRLEFRLQNIESLEHDQNKWVEFTKSMNHGVKKKTDVKKEVELQKAMEADKAAQLQHSASYSSRPSSGYGGRSSLGMSHQLSAPQQQRGNINARGSPLLETRAQDMRRTQNTLSYGLLSGAFKTKPSAGRGGRLFTGRASGPQRDASAGARKTSTSDAQDERTAALTAAKNIHTGESAKRLESGVSVVPSPSSPTLSALANEPTPNDQQRRSSHQVTESLTFAEPEKHVLTTIDLENEDKLVSTKNWLRNEIVHTMKLVTDASTAQLNEAERVNTKIIEDQLYDAGWQGKLSAQERIAFAFIALADLTGTQAYQAAVFLARLLSRLIESNEAIIDDAIDALLLVLAYDEENDMSVDAPFFTAALGTFVGEAALRSHRGHPSFKHLLDRCLSNMSINLFAMQKIINAALLHIAGLQSNTAFKQPAIYSPQKGEDIFVVDEEQTDAKRIQRLAQVWTSKKTEAIKLDQFQTKINWDRVFTGPVLEKFYESLKSNDVSSLMPEEEYIDHDPAEESAKIFGVEREVDSMLRTHTKAVPSDELDKTIKAIKELCVKDNVAVARAIGRAVFKAVLDSDEIKSLCDVEERNDEKKYKKQIDRINSIAPLLRVFVKGSDECQQQILFALADRSGQIEYPRNMLSTIISACLLDNTCDEEESSAVVKADTCIDWFDGLSKAEYKTKYAMITCDGGLQTLIKEIDGEDDEEDNDASTPELVQH